MKPMMIIDRPIFFAAGFIFSPLNIIALTDKVFIDVSKQMQIYEAYYLLPKTRICSSLRYGISRILCPAAVLFLSAAMYLWCCI
jgi:hypothetical protein